MFCFLTCHADISCLGLPFLYAPSRSLNTCLEYRLVSYVYPGRSKELLDELQKKNMTVLGTAA